MQQEPAQKLAPFTGTDEQAAALGDAAVCPYPDSAREPIDCVEIRAGRNADLPMIFRAWLEGAHASPQWRHVPRELFFPRHRQVLETVLMRGLTLVATPSGEPDVILGFCVSEKPNVLHWAYVKPKFRGFGICAHLLRSAAVDVDHCTFSHWTLPGRRHLLNSQSQTFDPYLLFGATHATASVKPVEREHRKTVTVIRYAGIAR